MPYVKLSQHLEDTSKLSTMVKSWPFQDQLVKLEDHLLYMDRKNGSLGLVVVNIRVKAVTLRIKSFMETDFGQILQKLILMLVYPEGEKLGGISAAYWP